MGGAKGNKLPKVNFKNTKVPEFDEFFDEVGGGDEPLSLVVRWNNGLDKLRQDLRKLGADLKKTEFKGDQSRRSMQARNSGQRRGEGVRCGRERRCDGPEGLREGGQGLCGVAG